MEEIVENIKDTVDIVSIIKPVYNFKASENERSLIKEKENPDEYDTETEMDEPEL